MKRCWFHLWCCAGEVQIPAVLGPFDPNQERTSTRDKLICARCGKTKLVEPPEVWQP